MNRTVKSALQTSAVTLLGMVSFSLPAFANDIIGVNSAVKGDVTTQTGEEEAREALVRDNIRIGDLVNSAKRSSLQVLLRDQTTFTVGPDCELTIDEFVYDPSQPTNTLKANVTKGMFRFMSGNISNSGPDTVAIDTPVASLGIRGTVVEGLIGAEAISIAQSLGVVPAGVAVDPSATLFVLRGPGQKRKGINKKGEISVTNDAGSVTLNQSGQAVFVPSKMAPPSDVFQLPQATYEAFSDQLRTQPQGGDDPLPFLPMMRAPSAGPTPTTLALAAAASALTIGLIASGGDDDDDDDDEPSSP